MRIGVFKQRPNTGKQTMKAGEIIETLRASQERWCAPSQRELAEKLGWPQSKISKILSGAQSPRLDDAIALAAALGWELTMHGNLK